MAYSKRNVVSGIYLMRNPVSGRFYVGQSWNIRKRQMEHRRLLINGTHPNRFIQNDWNKTGKPELEFSVIQRVDIGLLDTVEQFWIDLWYDKQNMCYNEARDVGATFRGRKCSPEHRQKLSEIQKQNPKLRPTQYKKGHIPHNKGKKGCYFRSTKTISVLSGYVLVSPDGAMKLFEMKHISRFCRERGLNHSHLGDVVRGMRKTHKGWHLEPVLNTL